MVEGNNFEGSATFLKCESGFADHNVYVNNSGERPDNTNPFYFFTGSSQGQIVIGGRATSGDGSIGTFVKFDTSAYSNVVIGNFTYTGSAGFTNKIDDGATTGRNVLLSGDWGAIQKYKSGSSPTISDSDFVNAPPNGSTAVAHDTATGKHYVWIRSNGAWSKADNDVSVPPGVTAAIRRTTDSSAVNSGNTGATLTSDSTLLFPLGASDHINFQFMLLFSAANTAMDVKLGLSVPTGATGSWGSNGAASATEWGPTVTTSSPIGLKAVSQTLAYGTVASSSALTGLIIQGVIYGDGTHSGNVTLQWAQNTADAADLVLKRGSNVLYTTM